MRRTSLLGCLALAGLCVTPPSLVTSSGPGARAFTGTIAVLPPDQAPGDPHSAWLTPIRTEVLRGAEPFGGVSALAIEQLGGAPIAIALADTGLVIRFRLTDRRDVRPARIVRLPRAPGDGSGKPDRDTESLAAAPDGGWWVGLEHLNELRRYSADWTHLTGRYRSRALADLPDTSGLEALAALPGRRLIGIAEAVRGDGRSPAFLWSLDGRGRIAHERPLWFRPPQSYRATDAVALNATELLVLTRRFAVPEGFTAALMLVPLTPHPGFGPDELTGPVIARFGPGYDNLEGMALTGAGHARTLWLISDDNISPLQRTVLASFRLSDPRP